jgi:hypothetical protein
LPPPSFSFNSTRKVNGARARDLNGGNVQVFCSTCHQRARIRVSERVGNPFTQSGTGIESSSGRFIRLLRTATSRCEP